MSWLSGIAGKAEALLNKIDENAANVLNTSRDKEEGDHLSQLPILTEVISSGDSNQSEVSAYPFGPPPPQSERLATKGGLGVTATHRRGSLNGEADSKDRRDSELLEFLNGPGPDPSSSTGRIGESNKGMDSLLGTTDDVPAMSASAESFLDGPASSDDPSRAKAENRSRHVDKVMPPSKKPSTSEWSMLRAENELLKGEVASLNREMEDATNRTKTAEKALTAAKEEALWASSETRTRDRQILDIEDRLCSTQRQVNDLQKQLDEKDKTMTQGREDADRLAGSQKAALETIKSLESELARSRGEIATSAAAVSAAKAREAELSKAAAAARGELEAERSRHDQYKAKAKKVLWEKEGLIETLRSGNQLPSSFSADEELQQAIRERDFLREEASQLSEQVSTLTREVSDLEERLAQQLEFLGQCQTEAAGAVAEARTRQEEATLEVKTLQEELIFVQSDFSRRQTDFLAQLRDRDQELESLRTPGYDGSASGYQAAGGGGGGGGGGGSGGGGGGGGENNPDLEERISQLTESLLQKQALLEAISAEKTALVFQVERMQSSLEEASSTLNPRGSGPPQQLSSGSTHGSYFFRESPFDSPAMRALKQCLASLDDVAGRRIWGLLRRYPAARVFLLVYGTLLHLWVFLILFASTPDPSKR